MRDGAKTDFARVLRKHMTDAEQRLWRHLRRRHLAGHRFRRQHPFGPYVLDFVCLERGLVVEVDGGQHVESGNDRVRDRYLAARGLTVLRCWNDDVLLRTDAVLERIIVALDADAPPPQPSPASGGGGGSQ